MFKRSPSFLPACLPIIATALLAVLGSLPQSAHAEDLRIRIDSGATGAIPIAIVPFGNETGGPLPENVTEVIRNDLARSGLFAPLDEDKMLEKPTKLADVDLPNWRANNVDNLVIGNVRVRPGGGYLVRFHLVDVFRAETLAAYEVPTSETSLRSGAHRVADHIFEALTGTPGVFDTRIAYVTARGSGSSRSFSLVMADADGANSANIATGDEPILSPAWSPDGTQLAYVQFVDGQTAIFVRNVRGSAPAKKLVSRSGINGAPAWSPDGRFLAAALSFSGNAEIYRIDASSGSLKRLTNSRAIDTEPAWSPDGSKIIFTSDRAGRAQIYEMDADGGDVRRLSFAGRSNTCSEYSPDGKRIALVNYDDQGYRIGVLDVETRDTTILSRGPLDECPSFAPNGAQLIYAKRGGQLATVTVDGQASSTLTQSTAVREPAWGPYSLSRGRR